MGVIWLVDRRGQIGNISVAIMSFKSLSIFSSKQVHVVLEQINGACRLMRISASSLSIDSFHLWGYFPFGQQVDVQTLLHYSLVILLLSKSVSQPPTHLRVSPSLRAHVRLRTSLTFCSTAALPSTASPIAS